VHGRGLGAAGPAGQARRAARGHGRRAWPRAGPRPRHDRLAEAQAFYDQGVAYLHSYVWIEAARAFRQALRSDPKLALAHLGLSRVATALEDKATARRELELGEALASGSSPRERRRLGVRRAQLDALDELTNPARHAAYKQALDEALAQDMDDVELWLLRGNAEEATAAGRGQRGGASSVAFYERALQLSPDHLAAHHYLVHSYEMIGRIDDALAHGEVYARLAPGVPHAHHMWAHDLRRVGRTRDAIAEFLKADALEKAYYAAEGVPAELDWHHQHNLDLLATSYQHQGQLREAEALMRQSFALPPPYEYSAFNKKEWPVFLLGRGRVADAREAAQSLVSSRFAAARAIGHVALAQAALAAGSADTARAEAALAERETGCCRAWRLVDAGRDLPVPGPRERTAAAAERRRRRRARTARGRRAAAAGRTRARRLDAGALRAGVDRAQRPRGFGLAARREHGAPDARARPRLRGRPLRARARGPAARRRRFRARVVRDGRAALGPRRRRPARAPAPAARRRVALGFPAGPSRAARAKTP
jgi:tetratricopeptide (TPR) repeat protein